MYGPAPLCPPQSHTDWAEDEKNRKKNCVEEKAYVTTSQNTPSVSFTKTYGLILFTVTLLFAPKSYIRHKYALWEEYSFSVLKPALCMWCFKD